MNAGRTIIVAVLAGGAVAAGLNVGVEPGVKTFSGTVVEWPVPTPKLPRDPAVAQDGSIYFAVGAGGRIGRFDPRSRRFREWIVPTATQPQSVVAAADGKVLFGGSDIGELDPATGAFRQYKCPSRDCNSHALVIDAEGNIWFTDRQGGRLGKLDRAIGGITEYKIGDDPYALALDKRGNVWVTRMAADRVTKFDPATGDTSDVVLARGSQPRRIALAPDGMLWVALYGAGRLAKIDPATLLVTKEYLLPGGPNTGPYAINADAAGRIWVSAVQTDSVIMLNPRSETIRVFKLPTRDGGVRSAALDADGRYWYIGSLSGRLGVVE